MRINLALSNISHNKARAALSVAGIGTAILLMLMQLGFRGAVENTATTIYEKMDFDLMVRSPEYLHFVLPSQVPRSVLNEIAGEKEVASVAPFHVSLNNWYAPAPVDENGKRIIVAEEDEKVRGIVVMAIDPVKNPFLANETKVVRDISRLTSPDYILIDQKSFRDYGPRNGFRFDDQDIGVETKVGQKSVRINGLFEMGSGLTANGALMINEQGFDEMFPFDSTNNVSMGLIKFRPGLDAASRAEFCEKLRSKYRLDNETKSSAETSWLSFWNKPAQDKYRVEVLTKQEVLDRELNRWLGETPIGFIFNMGVGISLIVGAAIVYMILSTDVSNRIGEYATLKAMGYTNFFLSMVILKQAAYLAIFAFIPSLLLSFGLYSLTAYLAQIPIEMTLSRVIFVLLMSIAMCAFSGTLALRKLWKAEPAELF